MLEKLPILKNRGNNQWQIIEDTRNAEYSLKIEVSSNGLIALMSFKKLSAQPPNVQEVLQKISNKKLKLDNLALLGSLFKNIEKIDSIENYILAKGTPPIHGKDSSFEKFFEDSEKINFAILNSEQVDYKAVSKIHSVKAGDKLAKYISETIGKDGVDVFGKPIPSHSGKPNKFLAGKNVHLDEADMILYADVDGIPEVLDGLFKVESVFNVENDVDLNVGHIKFSGDVLVGGDVLDGFRIESEGDIQIRGTVGASELTAKGKIVILGGVAGKQKGRIVCRELQAKFLNESIVESQEGVHTHKEIMNSVIYCNGPVTASSIIGGRIIVKSSLEVQTLGSDQNVETIIEVGTDFEYIKLYEEIIDKLPELDLKLYKQVQLFMPFIDDPDKLIHLDEEKLNGVMKVYEYFKKLKKERFEFEEILDDCQLVFRLSKQTKRLIKVNKQLHEAVKIKSRFSNKKILEEMKGPIFIREDLVERTFLIGST